MATTNPFNLLVDNENDDVAQLIAVQQKKAVANKSTAAATAPPAAKLPSKPLPPAQAVRELRNNTANVRDGAVPRAFGRGRGDRGAGIGLNRDHGNVNINRYGSGGSGGTVPEEADSGKTLDKERGSNGQPRGSFRGGRRGSFVGENAESGLHSERRVYERRSGTGRGYELKREGTGRGNWGSVTDDVNAQVTEESMNFEEKPVALDKQLKYDEGHQSASNKDKENSTNEEENEQEDNEMTLDEYEKAREEKRKALLAMKAEERKVELDKDLQLMQQLSIKKTNDDVFIKLSSDKDMPKRRDNVEKEERAKKAMSINQFLKPPEGERFYHPSGRGRGRGRVDRGSLKGDFPAGTPASSSAPSIADQGQFPTLGCSK